MAADGWTKEEKKSGSDHAQGLARPKGGKKCVRPKEKAYPSS